MDRAEWLAKMRLQAEALYDHLAPAYWVSFGLYDNETHRQFVQKLLSQLNPHSNLLDAACGAGRYDGLLLEAGHNVLGIDQSGSMLARAREVFPQDRYPQLQYVKKSLQGLDFQGEFDGAICIDALEHVCPEDWPGILAGLHNALKPKGLLYFTIEIADAAHVSEAYERARQQGLPVVPGEIVDEVDAAYGEIKSVDLAAIPKARAAVAVYHFYPAKERVLAWLQQAGLAVEAETTSEDYWHVLSRRDSA